MSGKWKDHPVIIAATAASATVGVCILITTKVVFPTQQAVLLNKVQELNTQVNELKANESVLSKRLRDTELELRNSENKLAAAQHANLFSAGNAYPVGLGLVRIGDPISKVADVFPKAAITRNDTYITVKGQNKIFSNITYYFNEEDKNQPITHISFSMDYSTSRSEEFLQNKLVEALGKPKQWSRKGFFSWACNFDLVVYKSDSTAFLLMSKNTTPGYWPKK